MISRDPAYHPDDWRLCGGARTGWLCVLGRWKKQARCQLGREIQSCKFGRTDAKRMWIFVRRILVNRSAVSGRLRTKCAVRKTFCELPARSLAHQFSDRPHPTSWMFAGSPNVLTNCVTLKMSNCLTKPSDSQVTCCTHCCCQYPLRRNGGLQSPTAGTLATRTYQTAISLHASFTETHHIL